MSGPIRLEGAIVPDWPAHPRVGAIMSTRAGGASAPPFDTLNLGRAVGDDPGAVEENRRRFDAALGGARPVWLSQVHGAKVLHLRNGVEPASLVADASIVTEPGIASAVMVADCMPVLLAAPEGRGVGAAHAGWRGAASGVVEGAAMALAEATDCAPADLVAWLGPCIGPRQFEVGSDVLEAFGASPASPGQRFVPRLRDDGSRRWLADLRGLVCDRLAALGIAQVSGGGWCTVEDGSRFFSFRRDRVTGRMAAAVWLRG